jgi:hypothetical protein
LDVGATPHPDEGGLIGEWVIGKNDLEWHPNQRFAQRPGFAITYAIDWTCVRTRE